MTIQDLLSPSNRKLTDYQEPEDIKRFLFIQKWLETITNRDHITALDIGCGNGHISRGLARLGCEVTGIDIDQESINTAKKECGDIAQFMVLDVAKLGDYFPHEHFDIIVCSEVLEHLDTPKDMVQHFYPYLRKNGILIVTTPNGFGPREVTVTKPVQRLFKMGLGGVIGGAKKMMGYKGATAQSSNPDLTHIQFFSKKRLIDTVSSGNDLELLEFGNANYLEKSFPYSLLYKGNMEKKAKDCLRADKVSNKKASGWNTAWRKPA